MSIKNNEHMVIPSETKGLFTVINTISGDSYEVDTKSPYCKNCPAYKYTKKNKKGEKKPCKHIKMCKGIIETNKIK